ncbi:hypothetical protein [Cupriavidus sp. RAF12]|uniref:hypothetical protein n=1 Tax=Cupriavidus sp. RAF12 TaxID=3233050 RepID=UPI003F8FA29B
MKRVLIAVSALCLAACSTYMPQRYSISADNNVALKSLSVGNINVGSFSGVKDFNGMCRGAGPIAPPDSISFEAYVQKALADELKVAGMFDDKTPKVTLSGALTQLEFSSSRALTGGSWDIGLVVSSSNGKKVSASEHYEFNSGFIADTACKQTAEAYLPAVQNLIGKVVKSPEFKSLVVAE